MATVLFGLRFPDKFSMRGSHQNSVRAAVRIPHASLQSTSDHLIVSVGQRNFLIVSGAWLIKDNASPRRVPKVEFPF